MNLAPRGGGVRRGTFPPTEAAAGMRERVQGSHQGYKKKTSKFWGLWWYADVMGGRGNSTAKKKNVTGKKKCDGMRRVLGEKPKRRGVARGKGSGCPSWLRPGARGPENCERLPKEGPRTRDTLHGYLLVRHGNPAEKKTDGTPSKRRKCEPIVLESFFFRTHVGKGGHPAGDQETGAPMNYRRARDPPKKRLEESLAFTRGSQVARQSGSHRGHDPPKKQGLGSGAGRVKNW